MKMRKNINFWAEFFIFLTQTSPFYKSVLKFQRQYLACNNFNELHTAISLNVHEHTNRADTLIIACDVAYWLVYPGFVLKERSICQSGSLKFGTMKFFVFCKEGAAMANGIVKWFDEKKG